MIHISQVGVRNMVVFAAYVEGPPVTGTEQLNTASKLGREVEVSCPKHGAVEIEKSASRRKEWLDAAIVDPIYLRTDGAATSAIGILTSFRMPRVSDQCHWNDLGNPANREWAARVYQSAITAFYLVQASIDGVRECVLVCELPAEPGAELIERRTVLSTCGTDEQKRGDECTHKMREVAGAEPAIG